VVAIPSIIELSKSKDYNNYDYDGYDHQPSVASTFAKLVDYGELKPNTITTELTYVQSRI
jgi:hypothetical protein